MTDDLAAELLAMAQRLREVQTILTGNLEQEWLRTAIDHLDDILVLNEKECSCCGPSGWEASHG